MKFIKRCQVLAAVGGAVLLCTLLRAQDEYVFPKDLLDQPMRVSTNRMLAPGIEYRYHYFEHLYDGPVAINFLIIDWNRTATNIHLGVVFSGRRRECPSRMADENRALAAVNGGYHTTVDPSVPFYQLKIAGRLIPSKRSGGAYSIAFSKGCVPYIGPFNTNILARYDTVLSGDGVAKDGKCCIKPLASESTPAERQKRRAPRTMVGQITNQVTILAVADGRTKESLGLSLYEIGDLMVKLGCRSVINLDGGGSSVMYLGDTEGGVGGVVSHPSDNGRFDAKGERRVCDSLMILDGTNR